MPSWDWQNDAACQGESLVLFFGREGERQPERDRRERQAKAVCAGCWVRAECLGYSLARPERYGTWGGLGEEERASARRSRMRRGLMPANTVPVAVDRKECRACKEMVPAAGFYKDGRLSDGLSATCQDCAHKAARLRREARRVAS